MEKDKIKEILEERFSKIPELPKKRHIIFWYDEDKSFKDIIDKLELKNAKILKILRTKNKNNEDIYINIFNIKYNLEFVDMESNFLIYSEYPKPANNENYLLDIELYSEMFEADRTSMIVEELELDRKSIEIKNFIRKNIKFFDNKKRVEKLKKIIENPKTIEEKKFKLAVLASIVNSESSDFIEILKNLILDVSKLNEIKKYMEIEFLYSLIEEKFGIIVENWEVFLKTLMITYFYRQAQENVHTNLEKYYSGKTNEIYVFVDSLLQNKQIAPVIKNEFYKLGLELNIKERIDELEFEKILKGYSFEYFDKVIINKMAQTLNLEIFDYDYYELAIRTRLNNSLWIDKYENLYRLILSIIKILKLKKSLVIKNRESIVGLYNDYVNEYYKMDKYYRHFYFYYDLAKENEISKIFDEIEKKISNFYEKEYLEVLQELWAEKICEKEQLVQQRNFYKSYIAPLDTRVAVIISDGLRYEVGQELKRKIEKEANIKEINLYGMLTDLPSRTFLGMANLLPYSKEERIVNLLEDEIIINGINSSGTGNREKILKQACQESSAIIYDTFKNMSRNEQEEYIKGKKVIYIYHDSIDAIGDKGKTENRTFEACNTAIQELSILAKNLSSLGIVNIYITSDHGFLYERKIIEEYNKIEIKDEKQSIGKRYVLSKKEIKDKSCISIKTYDLYGTFPKKNQRIKANGNGLQFVHGGLSPQEMVIPLIHYISGSNSKRASKVGVRIKDSITKITSNLTKFTIYQLNAVSQKNKFIERDIIIALYDKNKKISDEYKITLNAKEDNYEYSFSLTLSGNYKKVTLKVMDSETKDIIESKEYEVSIGIISDLDF